MEQEQYYEDWSIVQSKMVAHRRTVLDWIAQESILMSSDMRIKVSKCLIAGKGEEERVYVHDFKAFIGEEVYKRLFEKKRPCSRMERVTNERIIIRNKQQGGCTGTVSAEISMWKDIPLEFRGGVSGEGGTIVGGGAEVSRKRRKIEEGRFINHTI